MKRRIQRRCLSGVDAAFLYLEREELPLHIAGLLIFEGPLPFDEFVATLESRLHLIPRYRQVAIPAPFNLGHPVWEYARDFDIREHISQVRLDPPGGQRELEALASLVLSTPMDRGKPLWDLRLVDGLADGRGAMILRVHHSMADGVSGMGLLKAMLDPTPEHSAPARKVRFRKPKASEGYSLEEALGNALQGTLESVLASEAVLLGLAGALAGGQMKAKLERLFDLAPELAASVERLPFNKPCQVGRKFCCADIEFADAQAIRAVLGGTINDVVLTVVARAIARYTKLHGETVTKRFVRIVCPVSLRNGEQGESMGNRISFMPVALPLDVARAGDHLKAVARRTEIMKNARAADLVALAATWLGAAPPPLQKMFWSGIPLLTLPAPLFNLICTNVPGPAAPMYSCGRRLVASYPHVPTGYDLGVNCAVGSYAGKMFFGLTADAHACPDVERLRDFLTVAFGELCRAAGVKKARAEEPREPEAVKAAAGDGSV